MTKNHIRQYLNMRRGIIIPPQCNHRGGIWQVCAGIFNLYSPCFRPLSSGDSDNIASLGIVGLITFLDIIKIVHNGADVICPGGYISRD